MSSKRVVICGAGFIGRYLLLIVCYENVYEDRRSSAGSHVARAFASSPVLKRPQIVLASRDPTSSYDRLSKEIDSLAPPAAVDITKRDSLRNPFQGADIVVSLVGILIGSPATFDHVQCKGAENVALAAREQNAKLVHLSAIGADPNSPLPSPRTKALGEQAVLAACPNATIFRPSLVFGPGDSFFMVTYYYCIKVDELSEIERFATLSRFLPFMPVFGGGHSKFQPVYVGDLARAIEISARDDPEIESLTNGKIIEAGGPDGGCAAHETASVLMAPLQWSRTGKSWSSYSSIRTATGLSCPCHSLLADCKRQFSSDYRRVFSPCRATRLVQGLFQSTL